MKRAAASPFPERRANVGADDERGRRDVNGRTESVRFESLDERALTVREAAACAALARHEVRFSVGRSTIAVRFSRASAAAAFADRFGDMPATRAADLTVYAVVNDRGAFFWRTPEHVRCWPRDLDDALLVFFADNFAMHEYLSSGTALGLHAAVIASASHLIALTGVSTAGKTTTALAAVGHGFTLYSDERCIIDDGCVVSFLRAMTLRAGGRAALLAGSAIGDRLEPVLRALPAQDDVSLRPRTLAGAGAGGPARRLDAIFIIEGQAAQPHVERREPLEALPVIALSTICRERGLERIARLRREFGSISVYGLQLGTPDDTVNAIAAALR
jgi:hypothetical protein